MKKLEDFGVLMLGTRLKRLSDRMYGDIDAIYRERGITLSSRCFAPLVVLLANGPMAISELAAVMGQSHAAVSQVSKILLREKVIDHMRDPNDERRRLLFVNDKGRALAEEVNEMWEDLKLILTEAINASGHELLAALSGMDEQLDRKSLRERIVARESIRQKTAIDIIPYHAQYRDDFKQLNIEWLEKYFYVEAFDDKVLSDPETHILRPGGYIFFARLGHKIVGTSALIKDSDDSFELSKMSVTQQYQGLGIGRRLAQAAIDKFLALGAKSLFLESNRRLAPALKLYEDLGFVHHPLRPNSHYQRADVHMIYKAGQTETG